MSQLTKAAALKTTKPTTHSQPAYEIDGVVHYCVANMPGAVPRTSTFALNNQTEVYVLSLADRGLAALQTNSALRQGLNTYQGMVTYKRVAEAFGLAPVDVLGALQN